MGVAHPSSTHQAHAGQRPIAQSSCGAARSSECTPPSALSAVVGVSGSEDGLVLWLCVAQPCTFSCIVLPSVASLQRLSLFGAMTLSAASGCTGVGASIVEGSIWGHQSDLVSEKERKQLG